MTLLDAALKLADRGVQVFPVGLDKSPRTPHGFKDATTDPDTIRGWRWDDVLVAAAVAPGTIVVDVDPRNGGDETMATLVDTYGTLPSTRRVRTRSGGDHWFYGVPEDVELRGTLGPGVDIKRAGKGYVVTPPSEGYSFVVGGDITPAPQWLIDELRVAERPVGTDEASPPKFFPFESGTGYGLAALEREMGRLGVAPEGGRNDALNRAAFSLAQLVAGGELDEDRARDDLLTMAERIGLEEREAVATIRSGWDAGEAEPRQAPPREDAVTVGSSPGDSLPDSPDGASGNPIQTLDNGAEARFWVDWSVDEPAPPFYLHPLLPKNAYVLVYGPTEAAKSMAWVGILSDGSRRGVRSSIYSLENPPALDRDRLRRWAPDPACLRLTNEPLDFNDPRQVEALIVREKDWETDVIFIDTYSMAFNSRSDDGNAKAIEFARRVRYVMSEVGCSVIVVDHTGFEGDEPRDASAKRQAVDVAILMRKSGEWAHGAPARFTMLNRKAARFANPFRYAGAIHDVKDTRGLELRWPDDEPEWTA